MRQKPNSFETKAVSEQESELIKLDLPLNSVDAVAKREYAEVVSKILSKLHVIYMLGKCTKERKKLNQIYDKLFRNDNAYKEWPDENA